MSKHSPAVVRTVLYNIQISSQTMAQIEAKKGLPKGSSRMVAKSKGMFGFIFNERFADSN